jgi:hypothetical protein
MIKCRICDKDFEPSHPNSKVCSLECKKKSRKISQDKYNKKHHNQYNLSSIKKLKGEVFKDIKGYEGNYAISNLGRVYSRKHQGLMKIEVNNNGYYEVTLCNKKHKSYRIHRLIGEHFIDNPNNHPMIDHIDRNRLNNKIENLRWCDAKTNSNNRDVVINRKGCICKAIDKRKVNDNIYEYTYYRVIYYKDNKKQSKRFKSLEEANKFHQSTCHA